MSRLTTYLRVHATAAHLGAILLLAALTSLPGTSLMPLLDRDEPRFSRATVEMTARGEWCIPYFNDDYRFDKPILTYWLMRAAYAVCGVGEFGARLHAVVCTLLIAFVLYGIGRAWFSAKAGLLAACCWLTAIQTLIHGRCAVADMPLVLGVLISQWGIYELLSRPLSPFPRLPFVACYGGLAFAFLAKGPVAWLVPALALVIFRWLAWRRQLAWGRLRLLPGMSLTLAIVAMWGIPALLLTNGQFWQVGMHKHVVERGLQAFHDRAFVPLIYYFLTFFTSLYPWSAFAGDLGKRMRQAWNEKYAYLVACFFAPYLVFCCYATQLPHYVMPGFPAFFLLLGDMLTQPRAQTIWCRSWFVVVVTAFMLAAVAALAVFWNIRLPDEAAGIRHAISGAGLVLLALSGIAIAVRYGKLRSIATGMLLVAVACGVWLVAWGFHYSLIIARLSPWLQDLPASINCASCRFSEPSLVFYSGRRWFMGSNLQELRSQLKRRNAQLVVIEENEIDIFTWIYQHCRHQPAAFPSPKEPNQKWLIRNQIKSRHRHAIVHGMNPARGTWVRLHVLYRPPSR